MRKIFELSILLIALLLSCRSKDTITFEKKYAVSGVVFENTNYGKMPLAKAIVAFDAHSIDTTDMQGNYAIEDLEKGAYRINVSKANYQTFMDTIFIDRDITINFTLTKEYTPPVLATVSGTVFENSASEETPLSEAIVAFDAHVDTTDFQGNYKIESLEAGTYRIKISKTNYQTFLDTISIERDTTLNFTLPPQNFLVGTVAETYFHKYPIAHAIIQIGSQTDTTDDSGQYKFIFAEPGTYNVHISNESYVSLDTTIKINSGKNAAKFILIPRLEDYFPLKVGNKWTFDYYYRYYYGATGDETKIFAERVWEVVEISENKGTPTYSIRDKLSGIEIRAVDWYSRYDTTALDQTIYFDFADEVGTYSHYDITPNGDVIILQRENMPHIFQIPICPWFPEDSLYFQVSRFHPAYLADTLNIHRISSYPDFLIRNVGILLLEDDTFANHNYHVRMKLKSAKLKK